MLFHNELTDTHVRQLKRLSRALRESYGYQINFKTLSGPKASRMVHAINDRLPLIEDTSKKIKYNMIKECLHLWTKAKYQSQLTDISTPSILTEALDDDSIDEAKVVIAAQELGDSLQKMIENVAKMQVQDLIPIADAMKEEIGDEQAKIFADSADQTLSELLSQMKSSKEQLDSALRTAQGTNDMADDPLGGEFGGDEFGGDLEGEMGDDEFNMGDLEDTGDLTVDDVGDAEGGLEDPLGGGDEFGGDDAVPGDSTGRELKDEI